MVYYGAGLPLSIDGLRLSAGTVAAADDLTGVDGADLFAGVSAVDDCAGVNGAELFAGFSAKDPFAGVDDADVLAGLVRVRSLATCGGATLEKHVSCCQFPASICQLVPFHCLWPEARNSANLLRTVSPILASSPQRRRK